MLRWLALMPRIEMITLVNCVRSITKCYRIIWSIYQSFWSFINRNCSMFILPSRYASLLLMWHLYRVSHHLLSWSFVFSSSHEWFLSILLVQFWNVKIVFRWAHCRWTLSICSTNILRTISKLLYVSLQLNRIIIIIRLLSSLVFISSNLVDVLGLIKI